MTSRKQCSFNVPSGPKAGPCLVNHNNWSTVDGEFIGSVHLKRCKNRVNALADVLASLEIHPPDICKSSEAPSSHSLKSCEPINMDSEKCYQPLNNPSSTEAQQVFTDGACKGNGKSNALGGVGVWWGHGHSNNVSEPLLGKLQTNQRAELTAALIALYSMDETNRYVLVTDSMYVTKGITEWAIGWVKHHWKNSKGEQVSNIDLWKRVLKVKAKRHVEIQWVKGHSRNKGNDFADRLATEGCGKDIATAEMQNKVLTEIVE